MVPRLLARASPGHELVPLLEAWDPEREVTLEGLIAELAVASARPGPAEVTLRWMQHIAAEGERR